MYLIFYQTFTMELSRHSTIFAKKMGCLIRSSDSLNLLLFTAQTMKKSLKIQSCKLYNNKYMFALTQITNTEIFAFIAF